MVIVWSPHSRQDPPLDRQAAEPDHQPVRDAARHHAEAEHRESSTGGEPRHDVMLERHHQQDAPRRGDCETRAVDGP